LRWFSVVTTRCCDIVKVWRLFLSSSASNRWTASSVTRAASFSQPDRVERVALELDVGVDHRELAVEREELVVGLATSATSSVTAKLRPSTDAKVAELGGLRARCGASGPRRRPPTRPRGGVEVAEVLGHGRGPGSISSSASTRPGS
jgi:hypothetical protein